jgi:hypothetical protein
MIAALALPVSLAACNDSDEGPDARVPNMFDAAGPDARLPDAMLPDAAPTYSGSISIQEVRIQGIPTLGQGIQISIGFEDSITSKPPLMQENAGPTGCKVWEYTPAELPALVGNDEGTIQLSKTSGTPVFGPCTFLGVQSGGYRCPAGMGVGGTVGAGPMAGLFTFTDADATFTANTVAGAYLLIANGGPPTPHPIVQFVSATTVVVASQTLTVGDLPATAGWFVMAGLGPIPGVADPGFIANGEEITAVLTPGGGKHFAAASPKVLAASSFTLDDASATRIVNIPTDGTAFTVGCTGTGGSGCETTDANGSILLIQTTDGDVTGKPAPFFPPITAKRVTIRCAVLGAGSVTVPAAYSAKIMTSGATRIQATFLRNRLVQVGSQAAGINYVAGHGVVGFTK